MHWMFLLHWHCVCIKLCPSAQQKKNRNYKLNSTFFFAYGWIWRAGTERHTVFHAHCTGMWETNPPAAVSNVQESKISFFLLVTLHQSLLPHEPWGVWVAIGGVWGWSGAVAGILELNTRCLSETFSRSDCVRFFFLADVKRTIPKIIGAKREREGDAAAATVGVWYSQSLCVHLSCVGERRMDAQHLYSGSLVCFADIPLNHGRIEI